MPHHIVRRALPALLLGAAACRVAPIQAEVGGVFAGEAPFDRRAEQIRVAGAGLGWVIEQRSPGVMVGMLNLRTHQANVEIPYDTRIFLVRYVSSTNLRYTGDTIHPNYNSWARNLRDAIQVQSAI